jgi:uncharacterized protein YdaU (DUF1376 family)
MVYVQWHIGDWEAETRLLSPLEKGVYMELLMLYYSSETPLLRSKFDRITRRYTEEERAAFDYVLSEYFEEREDGFHQVRCDREIALCHEKSDKARKSIQARWAKKPEKRADECTDEIRPNNDRTSTEVLTNNQKPITNNQRIESTDVLSAQAQAPASTPVRRRKRPSSACPFAADAVIPADYLEVAQATGVGNPQACFGKFVNHALANDRRLVDWKAGFRTWCANELQYHPNQQTVRKPLSQRTAADYADWLS